MARTDLTVNQILPTGTDFDGALVSANADGNAFLNGGRELIYINNGSGGSITVTIVTSQTVEGLAVADQTVTIADGEGYVSGAFAPQTYNQPDTGKVHVDYSAVTSVTVAVFRL